MKESSISVRYARSLFMAAEESKSLDTVMNDMKLVRKTYQDNMFREVIESPVVKPSEKKLVINDLFAKNVSKLTLDFLNLLVENKRETFMPDIARNFHTMYKESKGIKDAEIILPGKVDPAKMEKFKEILKKTFNSEIELEAKIKPEIIGGFILKVEDEQYDASVASELTKIRKKLVQTTSDNKL